VLSLKEPLIKFNQRIQALTGTLRALLPWAFAFILGAGVASGANQDTVTGLVKLSLEELTTTKVYIVYGASKYEQKTTEAPSSVSIVTEDEIKRYGYRTLADILQSVQGFHVSYDRNYAFLGARGINLGDFNSRNLLLVDGHRVNNNLTDGAFIDTAFILDVDLIDHVEIIRGPGSVLYGNNAFFGVINVVTRKPKEVNGVEASVEYGGFDTYKGRVTYGKSFHNGVQLLLSGTYYDSAGPDRLFYEEYNDPAHNNGIVTDRDDDSFGSFFGSVAYKDFTLQGGFISREKGNPTAQYFTAFNDPRLRTVDDRSYVDLKFAHEFPEVVDVMVRAYYDRADFEIGYPFGDPVATTLFKEVQTGEWWGAEVQLSKRLWDEHVIIAGAEYRDDFRQDQRVFDQSTTYMDVQANRQSHGVYLQADFALRTNLHFNGGVRYDQYGDFDPSFNPRLALIYNPIGQTTFKFLYGTAFRSPNFLELNDPRFQDLEPEEITSFELVYEQGLGEALRLSLTGFFNEMEHLIIFESGRFTNINADSLGSELALEYRPFSESAASSTWASGIRARTSYTYQQTRNLSASREFADFPEHLVKLNLSVPVVKDKVFAGLEFQYTSSRNTVFTSATGNTLPGEDTEGFGVLNFTLFSQNLIKNLEFSASIYNLLDASYADPSTRFHLQDQLPRDGRSFRLKLTYRF
jgi:outer membrane receptor for ferrienterochelin and colicins